jgi:hypothetical protein
LSQITIRLDYRLGAGTQHALGIARLGPDEVGDSAGRSVTAGDLLAKRLQLVERVTGDPDGSVIHLRQSLLELCGQTFGLDVLPRLIVSLKFVTLPLPTTDERRSPATTARRDTSSRDQSGTATVISGCSDRPTYATASGRTATGDER